MNRFAVILLAIFSLFISTSTASEPKLQLITTNDIGNISHIHPVRESRNAAVKINSPNGGHGSGAYVIYQKQVGVLTAAHVVADGSIYRITTSTTEVFGAVVWRDDEADLAFLAVEGGLDRKPIKLAIPKRLEPGVKVCYSGYPSSYDLLSVNGQISGFDSRGYVLIQGFGWFGASGSAVVDRNNKIVGIISALPVESFYGHPQVLETLILIVPLKEEHLTQIGAILNILN